MAATAARQPAPIRVASFIERLHVGGDETRLLSLAAHLDRDRFSHVVVLAVPGGDERDARLGNIQARYHELGIEMDVLGVELRARRHRPEMSRTRALVLDAARCLQLVGALTAYLRRNRVDVVDARLEVGTLFGVIAARLAHVPAVVATSYSPKRWRPGPLWVVGQLTMAGVDAVVSDAEATIEEYRSWCRLRRPSFHVIENGVEPAMPCRPRADVRAELGLPPGVAVVGQVARMIPRKGYEVLLSAGRLIHHSRPDVHFLLCGFAEDPSYRDELASLAVRLGIADRVVLTSYSGDVGDVLGAIDVFVHVSTFDSSPIAVHESMSLGLPAVVSRVGGTPELVVDGVTGILVPAGDPVATAEAVLSLLEDPGRAARIGAAAKRRFDERHRPSRMARAHERLFEDVLQGRRWRPRWRLATRQATDDDARR